MAPGDDDPTTIAELLAAARRRIARWTPSDAARLVAAGATLVDIRDSGDRLREGAIPGASVVPRNVLEWRADPTSATADPALAHASGPVILVCNDGYASSLAAATLARLGVPDVGDVAGGFRAWKAACLPVEMVGDAGDPPRPGHHL